MSKARSWNDGETAWGMLAGPQINNQHASSLFCTFKQLNSHTQANTMLHHQYMQCVRHVLSRLTGHRGAGILNFALHSFSRCRSAYGSKPASAGGPQVG